MKQNLSKLSIAALAGAAALTGVASSHAALILTETKVASGITSSASATPYDVWLVNLTGMTGVDATSGATGQSPEVLGVSGFLTDTASNIAAIGLTTSTGKATTYDKYITVSGNPQAAGGATNTTTYFMFPSVTGTSIIESGTAGAKTGTASSLGGSWFVTPSGSTGNVGGIQPGQDPNGVVGTDPYATNGTLAEVVVAAGHSATFTGNYSDYGHQAGDGVLAFTVGPVAAGQPVISLTSSAPTAYGANLGTLTLVGHNGSYNRPSVSFTPTATGFVAVNGFNPPGDQEIYALKLATNDGQTDASIATAMNALFATNGNPGGFTASAVATSNFAGLFSGYDILLTGPATSTVASPDFLGFDFTQDTTQPGITVSGIAAVPEPATAAGVILGAAGLLLGRRKSRIAVA